MEAVSDDGEHVELIGGENVMQHGFKVDHEGPLRLLAAILDSIRDATGGKVIAHADHQRIAKALCVELANNANDVFDCVPVHADGAQSAVLSLVVRESFQRAFTAAAVGFLTNDHGQVSDAAPAPRVLN